MLSFTFSALLCLSSSGLVIEPPPAGYNPPALSKITFHPSSDGEVFVAQLYQTSKGGGGNHIFTGVFSTKTRPPSRDSSRRTARSKKSTTSRLAANSASFSAQERPK